MTSIQRECRVCRRERPIEEFRISTEKGAHRRECRECERIAQEEYRLKRVGDMDFITRRRAAQARYLRRNHEKRKEYQRNYQRMYRLKVKGLLQS